MGKSTINHMNHRVQNTMSMNIFLPQNISRIMIRNSSMDIKDPALLADSRSSSVYVKPQEFPIFTLIQYYLLDVHPIISLSPYSHFALRCCQLRYYVTSLHVYISAALYSKLFRLCHFQYSPVSPSLT